MSIEPRYSYDGMPLKEWIQRVPNELSRDAVGLWQIIPALRASFGLDGQDLEDAVSATIQGLLERGAVPVRCGPKDGPEWLIDDAYGQDWNEVKAKVIADWVRRDVEPDVGDVWFAIISHQH